MFEGEESTHLKYVWREGLAPTPPFFKGNEFSNNKKTFMQSLYKSTSLSVSLSVSLDVCFLTPPKR